MTKLTYDKILRRLSPHLIKDLTQVYIANAQPNLMEVLPYRHNLSILLYVHTCLIFMSPCTTTSDYLYMDA